MKNVTITSQPFTDFISTEDAKEYLAIDNSVTTDDDLLDKLVKSATKFIKVQTRRELIETTYQEIIDGEDNAVLFLSEYPINSVTNIKITDVTVYENDESQDSSSFYIYKDTAMIRRSSVFPDNFLNIEVNYTAGWSQANLPEDITQATKELVSFKFNNKDFVGLESHSLGDEDLTFKRKDVPEEMLAVIDSYRRRLI